MTQKSATGAQTTGPILVASGGVSAKTRERLQVVPSAVANLGLADPSNSKTSITYNIDFASGSILGATRDNHDSQAQHIQTLFKAGLIDVAAAMALIAIESTEEYA